MNNKYKLTYIILIFFGLTVGLYAENPKTPGKKIKNDKSYELFLTGKKEIENGNIDKAISIFEQARKINPNSEELLYYLGVSYCRKGKYEEGAKILKNAYGISKSQEILNPLKNAYFMYGLEKSRKSKYQEGAELFSRVIAMDKNEKKAYFNRGVCYSALKNYDKAITDFDTAEQLGYKPAELLFNRALIYEKTGKKDKAEDQYRKLLKSYPDYARAHYNLAGLLMQKIDPQALNDKPSNESINHYKRALELSPDLYFAAYNISRIYYKRKMIAPAVKWLKKCLELHEDFPEAQLLLAELYLKDGAYNNSLAQIEIMEKKGYKFAQIDAMKEEIYKSAGQKKSKSGK